MYPEIKDVPKTIPWETPTELDWHFTTPWNAPDANDAKKCNPWGPFSYYLLCYVDGKYFPPQACTNIEFEFPNKYELVPGICEDIVFHLNNYATKADPRCPWDHVHSGVRDKYNNPLEPPPPIIPPDYTFPQPKGSYYIMNTVTVHELTAWTPIEVLSVSIVTDQDSWLWQFQITVATTECLDIVMPQDDVLKSVVVTINGYSWVCTVEAWNESRVFGKDAWTIIGRSPSLMFGDPISERKSYTETQAKQGGQLVNDIALNKVVPDTFPPALTNWEVNWAAYGNSSTPGFAKNVTGFDPFSSWYVPTNTLTYTNKTEIDVMKFLVEGIGAYIQTEPDCRDDGTKFYIHPKYPQHPWNWDDSNSDISWRPLIDSQFMEIGRSNIVKPSYQAVYVLGEAKGGSNDGTGDGDGTAVMAQVHYEGCSPTSSTTIYAPMVTHALVTSTKAGRELGRLSICDTGSWKQHSVRLNVLCPGNDPSSGLFNVGDMITVMERGVQWYGQVTGISINASVSDGLVGVQQVLSIIEYVGGKPCV
jgi:hypothetical protein